MGACTAMEPSKPQRSRCKRPRDADEPSSSTNARPLASDAGPSGSPCQKKRKSAGVRIKQRSSPETAANFAGRKTKGAGCMRNKPSTGQAKPKALASIPLANLKNARGSFTGAAIDYRLPCTASEQTTCQIVGQLSTWNEFLCKMQMELREMPGTRCQLCLSTCSGTARFHTTSKELRRAVTLVHWLLSTHRCVAAVDIYGSPFAAAHLSLLPSALCGNSFVKSLTLRDPFFALYRYFFQVIPSLAHLEILEYVGDFWEPEAPLKDALVLLLQTTASLTCLRIPTLHWRDGGDVQDFLAALETVRTLEELSVHTSLIAAASHALKEKFGGYVKNNKTLTILTVSGSDEPYKETMRWFPSGIGGNQTLLKLNLVGIEMDDVGAGTLSEVLKQNRSLRSFNWSGTKKDYASGVRPMRYYDSWFELFTQTETLEELTLPMFIWDKEQWQLFFKALAKNKNLESVTIEVGVSCHPHIFQVCTALKESGAASKVFLKYDQDLCARLCSAIKFPSNEFSDLCVGPVQESLTERLSRQIRELPSYTDITSIDVDIHRYQWNVPLFTAFCEYVESTTTLRKLRVTSAEPIPPCEPEGACRWFWTLLLSSLARNSGVRELGAEMCVDEEVAKALVDVVKNSRNIRRVHVCAYKPRAAVTFSQGLSFGIEDNYRLTCVTLEGTALITEGWFAIWTVAARNSGLVTRAAQYVSGAACDRYRAQALERVSLSPPLMEEVAEVASVSNSEAISKVREGLSSFQDLHDFMRLCGVVREKVACQPRKDGRTQLDDLNVYCWNHIRRYLLVEDVKVPAQAANAVDLQ